MICLGFSTSTETNSVCLFNKEVLSPLVWDRTAQGKSDALTDKIQSYLKKNKINFSDLNLIAVDKGPGSFTGCRIAANVAKTLAYGLKLQIFESSSLEILAYQYEGNSRVMSLLDAHRGLYYFQIFDKKENGGVIPHGKILALSLDQIARVCIEGGENRKNLVLLGNLKEEIFSVLKEKLASQLSVIIPKSKKTHFPSAAGLVKLAIRSAPSSYKSWSGVEPMYIRAPEVYERLFSNS
jgi:tRNA threonylcarbamoyl adenosine modification protein YeaZ